MFSAPNTSTTSAPLSHAPPPELEQALAQLSSHRTVLGYITLSRSIPFSIIKSSGVVFEGEQGKKYASAVEKIVNAVEGSLTELSANGRDTVSINRSPLPSSYLYNYCNRTLSGLWGLEQSDMNWWSRLVSCITTLQWILPSLFIYQTRIMSW